MIRRSPGRPSLKGRLLLSSAERKPGHSGSPGQSVKCNPSLAQRTSASRPVASARPLYGPGIPKVDAARSARRGPWCALLEAKQEWVGGDQCLLRAAPTTSTKRPPAHGSGHRSARSNSQRTPRRAVGFAHIQACADWARHDCSYSRARSGRAIATPRKHSSARTGSHDRLRLRASAPLAESRAREAASTVAGLHR